MRSRIGHKSTVPALAALFGLAAGPALCNAPGLLNFQGVLHSAAGTPLTDGAHTVRFTIYNGDSGNLAVSNEQETFLLDFIHQQIFTQLAHRNLVPNSETVQNANTSAIYVRGTDYNIDYVNGKLTSLWPGPKIPANTAVKVSYQWVASPEWTETKTVQTTRGLFATLLGATTPISPLSLSGSDWMQMEVQKPDSTFEALLPRQQLTAAPYALQLALPYVGTMTTNSATNAFEVMVKGVNANAIYGSVTGTSGLIEGVSGYASGSTVAAGVYGMSPEGSGVHGESDTGSGVIGRSTSAAGVYGLSLNPSNITNANHAGVWGDTSNGFGVYGTSSNLQGVWGESNGSDGVIGWCHVPLFAGVAGINTSTGNGIYGRSDGGGFAGYFEGTVHVHGNLEVSGSKNFVIDDPLDPANKRLYHASVESPDLKDMYDGVATTDAHGIAVVHLPAYFQALNTDFRYQLTCMGQFAQAIVAREIRDNRFTIKTDKPNVRVSWQVTGIRDDPSARANRHPVEERKSREPIG